MGLCSALFHWPPEVFWKSTRYEIFAAIEAAEEMNSTEDSSK